MLVPLWHWWPSSLLPVWGGVDPCGGIGSPGAVVPLCQVTLLASSPSLHHACHGGLVTPSICSWSPSPLCLPVPVCVMCDVTTCAQAQTERKVSSVDKRSEGMKHRTEWCAEADRCRCMRCGRGSKYMKMPGRCYGPKFLSKGLGKWRRRHLGGHDLVRRMDRQGEVLMWCRKCSGFVGQRMGPKLVNGCRPEQKGTNEFGKMMKIIQTLEEARVPVKEAKSWRIEGEKKRITKKEYKRLLNNFEMEGFLACGIWQKERGERR